MRGEPSGDPLMGCPELACDLGIYSKFGQERPVVWTQGLKLSTRWSWRQALVSGGHLWWRLPPDVALHVAAWQGKVGCLKKRKELLEVAGWH